MSFKLLLAKIPLLIFARAMQIASPLPILLSFFPEISSENNFSSFVFVFTSLISMSAFLIKSSNFVFRILLIAGLFNSSYTYNSSLK